MISLPKPRPAIPFRTKPKRLPERKSMTIALGLMALDGIVLAADSELSAGDFKLSGQKVFAVGYRPMMGGAVDKEAAHSCGVTGTGTVSYIEAVKERLFRNYSQTHDGERNFEKAFEQVVSEFYKEHVVPFLDYQTVECPDFFADYWYRTKLSW